MLIKSYFCNVIWDHKSLAKWSNNSQINIKGSLKITSYTESHDSDLNATR